MPTTPASAATWSYGVIGGVLAAAAGIAAFVIVPIVAVKRNRKPKPA